MPKINLEPSSSLGDATLGEIPTETLAGYRLSPQQTEILQWATTAPDGAAAIVEAVAGSGKTTTLVELCRVLDGAVLFTAFNKSVATDIGQKLADAGMSHVRSGTFHSLGFSTLRMATPGRRKVDGSKLKWLNRDLDTPAGLQWFTSSLVSLAKQTGVGLLWEDTDLGTWLHLVDHFDLEDKLSFPDGAPSTKELEQVIQDGIHWSQRLLTLSNERSAQVIDFDDMIYMPLLKGCTLPKYDWVLVDEAQDTNPTRRLLAERSVRPGGHLVCVGDRHQAIYGFTGADADALDMIEAQFKATLLPLTVTYRCPKAVVEHAQLFVPHIQPAPGASVGKLDFMPYVEFLHEDPQSTSAIICRNTKPLVQLAFTYIRRHVPCFVEGRDIGKGLETLARRWSTAHTVADLQGRLAGYLDIERERLLFRGKAAKYASVEDKVQTLEVLMETLENHDPITKLLGLIEKLFQDSSGHRRQMLTLSTIHKAKGKEWPTVYLVGRNILMPSPYATQPWQIEQERNLAYVGITRAQYRLVEVDLPPK
jgi:superfamily I DNA/RNA helicase